MIKKLKPYGRDVFHILTWLILFSYITAHYILPDERYVPAPLTVEPAVLERNVPVQTIHKFNVTIADKFALDLPATYKILDVQTQDNIPVMWVMLDDEAPTHPVVFEVYGTGHEISPDATEYIGSVQVSRFVWHIFKE